MGNANGKDDGADDPSARSNGQPPARELFAPNLHPPPVRAVSSDLMAQTPPVSPGASRPPALLNPQVPIAPLLPRTEGLPFLTQNKPPEPLMDPTEGGIPTMITWTYGGNDVAVEGSWDNWSSRKPLQRTGKDHSILLVLPSGIYHYKLIVDGEWRYIPELPHIADATGRLCNLLDVTDYVPENPESIAEFEQPASPDSSYSQLLPTEEDFAKEPALVPSHLQLTVLGPEGSDEEATPSRPQHVMLNHLFIEKGGGAAASQSMVALGLTHRFESKYVTVVLYKPLKR